MQRNYLFALAGMTAVLLCVLPSSAAPPGSRWGADYFPNLPLINQDGKTLRFYDDLVKGKIVAIDLIYTHCKDMCPLETARLAQVQSILGERVGKDIFFYSISIDPNQDTPEMLKAYAEKFHVGQGWQFLTGTKEDIDLISKKLGLYTDPDAANRDGHTPSLLIGNEATGQWMRNSALDNPRFLALMIGEFLDSWRNRKGTPEKSYAEAAQLQIDQGQYLFATRCASCHSIGHGDKIGPDLQGVARVREPEWLRRFIAAPDKMLADGDPIASNLYSKYQQVQMPNLRLTNPELQAILEFLNRRTPVRQ